MLRTADAAEAFVEDKGLAVAVHTRRLDDPGRRVRPAAASPSASSRSGTGSTVEPGRQVLEVRSHGMHKGSGRRLAGGEHLEAGGFLFAGDDLGDLEAFEAVLDLRRRGLPTLLVCSASREESALRAMSDVVVDGPDGVLDLMRKLTAGCGFRIVRDVIDHPSWVLGVEIVTAIPAHPQVSNMWMARTHAETGGRTGGPHREGLRERPV